MTDARDLAQARVFHAAVDPEPIRRLCAAYPAQAARADYGRDGLRQGSVRWVDEAALKEQFWTLIERINEEFFRFELEGLLEPLQYATYGRGDCFGWHVDAVTGQHPYRKLALSVQLSDMREYEGGDLQMQLGCWTLPMPKGAGDVIAFPTWLPHRIEPVTRGVRHALVVWAHGRPFR